MRLKTAVLCLWLGLMVPTMPALAATHVMTINKAQAEKLIQLYQKWAQAAKQGDLATFRALRTQEANQHIPPNASGDELKSMAGFIAPTLKDYTLVQAENTAQQARLVWVQQTPDSMSVLVVMFEKEQGSWKVANNHTQDYQGQPPAAAQAIEQALHSPEVQLR